MANKEIKKIPVDKVKFMEVLNDKKCSIRSLGSSEIGRTERTIRRSLDSGLMSESLVYTIATYLKVSPSELSDMNDSENECDFESAMKSVTFKMPKEAHIIMEHIAMLMSKTKQKRRSYE